MTFSLRTRAALQICPVTGFIIVFERSVIIERNFLDYDTIIMTFDGDKGLPLRGIDIRIIRPLEMEITGAGFSGQ